jgi:hypothetical protein
MFSIVHTASEYLDFFDVLCNKKEWLRSSFTLYYLKAFANFFKTISA